MSWNFYWTSIALGIALVNVVFGASVLFSGARKMFWLKTSAIVALVFHCRGTSADLAFPGFGWAPVGEAVAKVSWNNRNERIEDAWNKVFSAAPLCR